MKHVYVLNDDGTKVDVTPLPRWLAISIRHQIPGRMTLSRIDLAIRKLTPKREVLRSDR